MISICVNPDCCCLLLIGLCESGARRAVRGSQVRNEAASFGPDTVHGCGRGYIERLMVTVTPREVGRLLRSDDCAEVMSLRVPNPNTFGPRYEEVARFIEL